MNEWNVYIFINTYIIYNLFSWYGIAYITSTTMKYYAVVYVI